MDGAPHGELQVCEPGHVIREQVCVGTSEWVRARCLDVGMCVNKARVRGSGQGRVGVHTCVSAGCGARGAGAGASSPCCKLWLQTPTWGREGTARGSSGRAPPSFLLPDL